jgi:CMP/dCMP kinase
MSTKKLDVVTIDGPAGSGKSTAAKLVARELKFFFLDTGAMYRAVALAAVRAGIPVDSPPKLEPLLSTLEIHLETVTEGLRVTMNGEDVSEIIRQPDISGLASDYSTLVPVRAYCMKHQRIIGLRGNVVAEGRDMGTVVFPDARWKFFLTADARERAVRRWREEKDRGRDGNLDEIYETMLYRDHQDENRTLAPLKPAADAERIDSTHFSINEVVGIIVGKVRQKK